VRARAGVLLTVAALFAVMIGARPAEARGGLQPGPAIAATVGASLGALGVGSFIAGSVIERRTRFHVWLQCETRSIVREDVGRWLAGVEESRVRVDSRWAPTHVWLVGADAEPEVVALAHANGLRCFAPRGCAVLEL